MRKERVSSEFFNPRSSSLAILVVMILQWSSLQVALGQVEVDADVRLPKRTPRACWRTCGVRGVVGAGDAKLCEFAQPWLLRRLLRGMESMRWRLVGSSNPGTHRFEQTDAKVKDGRHAVAVRTSAFYAVPFFEGAAFQRKCLVEPSLRSHPNRLQDHH